MPPSPKRSANRSTKSRALGERDTRPAPRFDAKPHQHWLGAALIIAMTLLAYAPALRDNYVWDDSDHVAQTPIKRTTTVLKWIWVRPGTTPQYYPLTHTTFWLESRLWGLNPAGYHLVNVLLHAACALLLWRLVVQLELAGAWLAAAIFALHPVQVESVAWITELKNTQSTLFYLLAMGAAFRAWGFSTSAPPASLSPNPPRNPGAADRRAVNWPAYALCIVLFLAAVLSKTVTCTLPAALLLILWWKRGGVSWRDGLMLLPLLAIAVGAAKLTSGMEQWNVGAVGAEFNFSLARRVLIAGRALWFYAGKLFWPHPLIFIYPRWAVDPRMAWQWIFPAMAALLLAALFLARRRIGRGPLAATLFFAGTLFPALGFIDVYPMRFSFVADHFQYLASVGLIVLAVQGLCKLPVPPRGGMIAATALLAVFGGLTAHQALAYRDESTLWLDTVDKNPACWYAMDNLGADAEQRGDFAGAFDWYDRSLRVHPDQPEAHLNRGGLYQRLDPPQWDKALEDFEAAARIRPDIPRLVQEKARLFAARAGWHLASAAHMGSLAAVFDRLAACADRIAAAGAYEQVLAGDPRLEPARLEYAMLLRSFGRLEDAEAQYRQAIALNPASIPARSALAPMLLYRGDMRGALQLIAEAIDIDPTDARMCNNCGVVLMQAGQAAEAAEQFRSAIASDPQFPEAYDGLGCAVEALGQRKEAAAMYRRAVELKPDFSVAREHLTHVLGR